MSMAEDFLDREIECPDCGHLFNIHVSARAVSETYIEELDVEQ